MQKDMRRRITVEKEEIFVKSLNKTIDSEMRESSTFHNWRESVYQISHFPIILII